MHVLPLKRPVFLASFLLSHVSPLFIAASWSMLTEEQLNPFNRSQHPVEQNQNNAQKKRRNFSLMEGTTAFEKQEWYTAAEIFTSLHNNGALIPSAYLRYMQDKELLILTLPEEGHGLSDITPIPEAGKKLSESFLKASLAQIKYQTAINNHDDKAKKESIQDLADMTLNGNGHALSLFRDVYNISSKILEYLRSSHQLKKIKSLSDLYQKIILECREDVQFWSYLDPRHLSFYYESREKSYFKNKLVAFSNKELEYLSENYKKKPHLIKGIAVNLAKGYPNQPFWAHLAVENGANEGCVLLADLYSNPIQKLNSVSSKIPQEKISFLEYYVSRIHKDSSFEREKIISVFYDLINFFDNSNEENKIHKIKARKYYKMAADQGNKYAQHNYALMLRNGEGGEKNLSEACKYCKMSADQGNKDAQHNYALMLHTGEGGEQDPSETLTYYKMAADQGNKYAQNNYALMLYKEGGEKNLPEVRKYYKMAAYQGLSLAQYGYALMLQNGEGGEKNLPKARKYCKMAADQGNKYAQHNYALMLYKAGGEKNLPEARKYCKKAAGQGLPQAIMFLDYLKGSVNNIDGDLCDNNLIVTEHDLEAYMKIILDALEIGTDHSDEDPTAGIATIISEQNEASETNQVKTDHCSQESNEASSYKDKMTEETVLEQELYKYNQENELAYGKSRSEKQRINQAKKEAASRTCHTLTVQKKDYLETCQNPSTKMPKLEKKLLLNVTPWSL